MRIRRPFLSSLQAIALILIVGLAPTVHVSGQAHAQPRALDVPYVPTPEHIVDAMLRLAKPGPSDFLVDLGCGDGRIPITAALKFGTRGFGVDLNPARILEAKANAVKAKVADKVHFIEGDLFKTDFQKASVLTLYLLPSVNMRLRPQVLDMKPGTRVVSHAFNFEDWLPDASEQSDFRNVYYWVVPAKVAGRWSGSAGGTKLDVEIQQKFQMLDVKLLIDGKPASASGRMNGEEIGLQVVLPGGGSRSLSGRLDGTGMAGTDWVLKRL
jgi:precorrin-6B methylase 2